MFLLRKNTNLLPLPVAKKYAILGKITCFQGINNEKGNYMNVNESAENYLETIHIVTGFQFVRSVDIAGRLGFKKSSVNVAMKNLREKHIVVSDSGFITLTRSGGDRG